MPSKYSRKNRDRKGGHKTSTVEVSGSRSFHYTVYGATPLQRALFKTITKKAARRQAKAAISQALAWEALADEQFEAIEIAESYGDFWDDWGDISLDYGDDWEYHEYLREQEEERNLYDPWNDDPYDHYDYDHDDFYPSPFGISDRRNAARERSHADLADCTVVSAADVGKTISEILEGARIEADAERAWWRR